MNGATTEAPTKAPEPMVIEYWKNGKWVRARKVFYTEEEINRWYRRNRYRIDGLTVVKPLHPKGQLTLETSAQRVARLLNETSGVAA